MRSQIDYVSGLGKLNAAASTAPGGTLDTVTGLRIFSGCNSGDFLELTDAQALQASTLGVVSVNLLTAGSGQTNGTYTANANTGPAQIQYVIAGNVLTTITILNAGNGQYSASNVPTFTLAANGGTAGTVTATVGQLYSGRYMRVKLTAGLTGPLFGQALFWSRGADTTDPYAVTNVSASGQSDFAGFVIDPSATSLLPYCWIQATGEATALLAAAGSIGAVVSLPTSATNSLLAVATNPTYLGTQITAASGSTNTALILIRIPQARY